MHHPDETTSTSSVPAFETPVSAKNLPAAIGHAVSYGGVRHDLFLRESNGLAASGALVFRGRRILIYPRKYLAWMESRSRQGA